MGRLRRVVTVRHLERRIFVLIVCHVSALIGIASGANTWLLATHTIHRRKRDDAISNMGTGRGKREDDNSPLPVQGPGTPSTLYGIIRHTSYVRALGSGLWSVVLPVCTMYYTGCTCCLLVL